MLASRTKLATVAGAAAISLAFAVAAPATARTAHASNRAPHQSVDEFLSQRSADELARRGGEPSYTVDRRIPLELAEDVVAHAQEHGCSPGLTTDQVIALSLFYRQGDTSHDMAVMAPEVFPLLIPVAIWVGKAVAAYLVTEFAACGVQTLAGAECSIDLSWSGLACGSLFSSISAVAKSAMIFRAGTLSMRTSVAAGVATSWRLEPDEIVGFFVGDACNALVASITSSSSSCLDLANQYGPTSSTVIDIENFGRDCVAPQILDGYQQELVDSYYIASNSGETSDPLLPLALRLSDGIYARPVVRSNQSVQVDYSVVPMETGAAQVQVGVINEGVETIVRSDNFNFLAGDLGTPQDRTHSIPGSELLAVLPGSDKVFKFFIRLTKGAYSESYYGTSGTGLPILVDGPENTVPTAMISADRTGSTVRFFGSYTDIDDNAATQLTLQLVGPGGTQNHNLLPYLAAGTPSNQQNFTRSLTLANGVYTYRLLYSDGTNSRTNGDYTVRVSSTAPQVFVSLNSSTAQIGQTVAGTVSVVDGAGPVPGIEVGLQTDMRSPFFDAGGLAVRKVTTNASGAAAFSYRPEVSGLHTVLAMEPLTHEYDWTTVNVAGSPSGWTTTWSWSLLSSTATEARYGVQVHVLMPGGAPLDPGDNVYFDINHGYFDDEYDEVGASSIATNVLNLTATEANSGPEVVTLSIPRYNVQFFHTTDLPVGTGGPLTQVRSLNLAGQPGDNYSFAVAVSRDGRYTASIEGGGDTVVVRNLQTQATVRSVNTPNDRFNCVDFSPDGNKVVLGDQDGYLVIVTIADGNVISASHTNGRADIINVDWYASNRIAAATAGGTTTYPWTGRVMIVSDTLSAINSNIALPGVGNSEDVRRISCSAASQLCAATSEYGDDRWFLFTTGGSIVHNSAAHPDGNMYYALAFNEAGDRLLVGAEDNNGAVIVDLYSVSAGGISALTDPFTTSSDVFAATFFRDAGTERLALGGNPKLETFEASGGGIVKSSPDPAWTQQQSYHLEYVAGGELLVAINNASQTFYNVSSDQLGPAVSIVQPDPLPWSTTAITLTGSIVDASGVSSSESRIGNGAWTTLSLAPNGTFSLPVSGLIVGDTAVSVRATDTHLNTATASVTVTRRNDTTAPFISDVTPIPAGGPSGTPLTLLADIEDLETGVGTVSFVVTAANGTPVASGSMTPAAGGRFRADFASIGWADGVYSVAITAADNAVPANSRTANNVCVFLIGSDQPLFADGFETGDRARWSASAP